LVFTRTKHGADKVVKLLVRAGIRAVAIHGNKSQNARTRALEEFKSRRPPVLVATDIAARGLDVEGVSHVINYELPEVPDIYVHRIGRTARGGATGTAMSFCGAAERGSLRSIERLTRQAIAVADDHPLYSRASATTSPAPTAKHHPRPPAPKHRRKRTASPARHA
jgi:ATP-dependent RNA helicase RhlE